MVVIDLVEAEVLIQNLDDWSQTVVVQLALEDLPPRGGIRDRSRPQQRCRLQGPSGAVRITLLHLLQEGFFIGVEHTGDSSLDQRPTPSRGS